jgi:hypothetical protein
VRQQRQQRIENARFGGLDARGADAIEQRCEDAQGSANL